MRAILAGQKRCPYIQNRVYLLTPKGSFMPLALVSQYPERMLNLDNVLPLPNLGNIIFEGRRS